MLFFFYNVIISEHYQSFDSNLHNNNNGDYCYPIKQISNKQMSHTQVSQNHQLNITLSCETKKRHIIIWLGTETFHQPQIGYFKGTCWSKTVKTMLHTTYRQLVCYD